MLVRQSIFPLWSHPSALLLKYISNLKGLDGVKDYLQTHTCTLSKIPSVGPQSLVEETWFNSQHFPVPQKLHVPTSPHSSKQLYPILSRPGKQLTTYGVPGFT